MNNENKNNDHFLVLNKFMSYLSTARVVQQCMFWGPLTSLQDKFCGCLYNAILKICYIVADPGGVRGRRGFCQSVLCIPFGVRFMPNDIVGPYRRLRAGSIGVRRIGQNSPRCVFQLTFILQDVSFLGHCKYFQLESKTSTKVDSKNNIQCLFKFLILGQYLLVSQWVPVKPLVHVH